jgi:hypothetical protein
MKYGLGDSCGLLTLKFLSRVIIIHILQRGQCVWEEAI